MPDTHGIDAILHALYECISGGAGVPRDWDRFRSLLHPGARLVRTTVAADGTPGAKSMDAVTYEADTTEYFAREAFYETQIASKIERFGNIAHAFSVYESRHAPDDPKPFARGINSVQLYRDGSRWWVISVLWDTERDDNPIPAEYLR